MEVFTYNDYIKCIHTLRLNAVFQLAEEGEKYNLEKSKQKKKIDNTSDKIIERILENKKEVANLINDFIEPKEKIKEENLVKYTNNFIIRKYKSKEANVIYKLQDKNIFFLIEYKSSIENKMVYRMLNYCIDIIYDWNISVKIKKGIEYPIIVPIVIYTGVDKWNVDNDINKMQVSDYIFQNYKIDFKYNLIEIKKISTKILIQKNTLFSQIMALEKSKNYEEFKNILSKILKQSNGKLDKNLYDISEILLKNLLKDNYSNEILKEIYQNSYLEK